MKSPAPSRALRRRFLKLTSLIVLAWPVVFSGRAHAADTKQRAIVQPDPANPREFIERAFAMRRQASDSGDQPFGAVIVRDGKIVGQSQSRVVLDRDPTAHAEMEAIRDAARRLATRDLSGCVMYSSSQPCPMCEAAAYWAGLDGYFHGRDIAQGGAPRLCG